MPGGLVNRVLTVNNDSMLGAGAAQVMGQPVIGVLDLVKGATLQLLADFDCLAGAGSPERIFSTSLMACFAWSSLG